MKILNLEINNIRGIPRFEYDFKGENAVILGANGTGKSSILDAIDFLLTGDIARLKGEGTLGISLKRHGIHVDMSDQLAMGFVRATIQLEEYDHAISIERSVSNPERLVCSEHDAAIFQSFAKLAVQRQHMLERRQLLKFVHVTPSNRAAEIQALLNLEEIEKTRKCLRGVVTTTSNNRIAAERDFEKSQNNVKTDLELDSCEHYTVLEATNGYRRDLGLEPIDRLSTQTMKQSLGTEIPSEDIELTPTHLLGHVGKIIESIAPEKLAAFGEMEQILRNKLSKIRSDPDALRSLKRIELYRRGMGLIETDACPLCDLPLSQEKLKERLRTKIESASNAKSVLDEIEASSKDLRAQIHTLTTRLREEFPWSKYLTDEQETIVKEWHRQLGSLTESLQNSLKLYPHEDLPVDQAARLFVDAPLSTTLVELRDNLQKQVKEDANTNDLQGNARAKLTLLARDWPLLCASKQEYHKAEVVFNRSVALHDTYIKIRDEVLNSIYQHVSEEFTRLYRQLHRDDEELFRAEMHPRNAGLHLDVDFYGRGMFPPNALHSEGHQDSMGLCLFLVLSERLSGTDLQVILLDDVIMSVDEAHRKQLAGVLVNEFAHRQIILTTHDTVWVEQLMREGFATKSDLVEMQRWTVDTGPIYREAPPVWNLIESDLASDQTNAAGNKLRAWAESFSKQVCHNFRAPVPFRVDGMYTLADVFEPAKSHFLKYLNKAIRRAENNDKSELVADLRSVTQRMQEVDEATKKEYWILNWTSHDNPGRALTSEEVSDAVSAFRGFDNIMRCQKCGGYMELTSRREAIVCKCKHIIWAV